MKVSPTLPNTGFAVNCVRPNFCPSTKTSDIPKTLGETISIIIKWSNS